MLATGLSDSPGDHPLRFMFIDFNAFFAAVEQHDEPTLRGRPVIVLPLDSEHSRAIAVSYEARALGISRGSSVRDARALCPDIAIRVARHDRYVAMHGLLMEEIERHLPIARIYSIDECACRLDITERNPALAIVKAQAVKAGIAANIGESLRASIGLAGSPLLAKLAAELEKPDGLTIIETRHLPDALADLPLRAIPGIGTGVERRLARAGIKDFLSLWYLQPKQARAIWNSVVGERFFYALRGHDVPDEAPPEKKFIGHSRVLSGDYRRPEGARIVARALLLKAASRLRLYGLYAGGLNLGLRLRPECGCGFDALFPATQDSWTLLKQLDALWTEGLARMRRDRARSIGLVSVSLHGLRDTPPEPDLFVTIPAREAEARRSALWAWIDQYNREHQGQAITLASHRGLDLNYLGVKIAFSRVPDAAEFLC